MTAKYPDEEAALQLITNALTSKFDLKPVTVELDGRLIRRYGTAYYHNRVLKLSPKLLDYPDELDNTLRHEVAHFLAYDKFHYHGHGRVWKACAVECGARPQQYEPWKFDNNLDGVRYIYECGKGCRASAARVRPRYETGTCIRHGLRFQRTSV